MHIPSQNIYFAFVTKDEKKIMKKIKTIEDVLTHITMKVEILRAKLEQSYKARDFSKCLEYQKHISVLEDLLIAFPQD